MINFYIMMKIAFVFSHGKKAWYLKQSSDVYVKKAK